MTKAKPKTGLYHTQRDYYRSVYSTGQPAPWDGFFDGDWLKKRLSAGAGMKGKKALEIGAGRGRGSMILAGAGLRVVGMDYLLEPLREAAGAKGRGAPAFVNADLMDAPFKEGVFDLALDWGVFHHIRRKDTAEYMRRVTALLGNDGRLLLACFSTKFRHEGETARKRNYTVHHGHYDRFSTRLELKKTFSPWFKITAMEERKSGYFLLDMTLSKEK